MNVNYQIKPISTRCNLKGYWRNDIWDFSDSFFDEYRTAANIYANEVVDFSNYKSHIKSEIKYMFSYKIQEKEIGLKSIIAASSSIKYLAAFLGITYPKIQSIIDLQIEKATLQWFSFLKNKGITSKSYKSILNKLYSFYVDFYDSRDEFEKDIWDCRKISCAKITFSKSNYLLNFTQISYIFRELVKRYIKYRITFMSRGRCEIDIMSLRLFLNFIHKQEPLWSDLKKLNRSHIEEYLVWYHEYTKGWKEMHVDYLIHLHSFLLYIERAQYPEAPDISSGRLLYFEDIPKRIRKTENSIKHIPENVILQLEENIQFLKPVEYIPIVILLRASGWRISDILSLKYDTCLERTPQGWYLCGDIAKTNILNHRVPITDEVATIMHTVIEEAKENNTSGSNPYRLLFINNNGKRKGNCPSGTAVQNALNTLAVKYNIVNDDGSVFHFRNHAFRHTKGVELINNGMSLVHVQKWMAHVSPEMTLRYAKILDVTMRKSWEEATKRGLFRINELGKPIRIDISDIENEDIIEWEYIRHNLDAVRMPLGFCMKPKKQECHTQLNPCLTCRNLCTTPDFIHQYELEIQETKAVIERGKTQNRSVWVEKNQALLEKYQKILVILKDGKTHHKAGKRGREYIEEERIND